MRRSSTVALLLTISLLCVCPDPALGWGEQGHIYINQVAAQKIPDTMPAFLRTKDAAHWIAYLGPEPDRWRSPSEYALKEAQDPDHYIDLERVSWLKQFPPGRYEFYRLLYEKWTTAKVDRDNYLPERVGLLPYITIEVYDRLKTGFREYRQLKAANEPTEAVEHNIIFYAGWLGHYVADGSQPLHTTINYNGWVENSNPHAYTTEPGIHSRFETGFVDRDIALSDFASLVGPPQKLADPFHDFLNYLWRSHGFVERVYQLDKEGGFNGAGSSAALKFTEERLAAGSQMLLDFWYTAWLDSAN